jgi:hypothetical protein
LSPPRVLRSQNLPYNITKFSTRVHTKFSTRVQLYSRRCVRTGGFGGVLARVAPSVLFGISQKVIANLVGYMQVLTLSSRHARASVHRRPCCRSLKAGCILKYNTPSGKIKNCEISFVPLYYFLELLVSLELKNSRELQNLSHNFLFYHYVLYFRKQPAFKLLQHGRR